MRILVVEDERTIAESIKLGLLDERFAVDVLYDGKEAYETASLEEYDCIILDIMLPSMDGLEVCRKLRAEGNHAPILMLTAKDTIDDRVKGLTIGADDYLIKPFSFEELLARVRSLIRRNHKNEPVLKVGTLELNPDSHIIKRSGKEIKVTGKEYALLEYFMRHPKQILTREQILTHVWDYSYESFSNIVDVLVRRLRNKIDQPFPKEEALFSTVRGLGYKIG